MVYENANLVYLKDLWKESNHSELDSNLGMIKNVKIISKLDEMHQYEDNNEFYLDFVDTYGHHNRYTIIQVNYEDDMFIIDVKEMEKNIKLYIGESFDDPNITPNYIEYNSYNVIDVFPDNVLDLSDYNITLMGNLPNDLVPSQSVYIDIETENVPPTMLLYMGNGMYPVNKIIKDCQTKAYKVYLANNTVIVFSLD